MVALQLVRDNCFGTVLYREQCVPLPFDVLGAFVLNGGTVLQWLTGSPLQSDIFIAQRAPTGMRGSPWCTAQLLQTLFYI